MNLIPTTIRLATAEGDEHVEGFTLEGSPLGIHQGDDGHWTLTLLAPGLAALRFMTEPQAHYALEVLSPMPWVEPYTEERERLDRLQRSFVSEAIPRNTTLARHLVRRMRDSSQFYELCGPFTETRSLVIRDIAAEMGSCWAQAEDWLDQQLRGAR